MAFPPFPSAHWLFQQGQCGGAAVRIASGLARITLKWSVVRYGFGAEEDRDAEEETHRPEEMLPQVDVLVSQVQHVRTRWATARSPRFFS
jgi:hypothetical protein